MTQPFYLWIYTAQNGKWSLNGTSVHPCHQPKHVERSSVFLFLCHKGISQRSELSAQSSSNFDLHLSLLVVQIADSDLVRQGGPKSLLF